MLIQDGKRRNLAKNENTVGQLAHKQTGTFKIYKTLHTSKIFETWKESKIVQNYANRMQFFLNLPCSALVKYLRSLLGNAHKQWQIIGTEQFPTILKPFFLMRRRDAQTVTLPL